MSQHDRPGRETGIGAAVDDLGRWGRGGPRPAPHADEMIVPGPVG